MLPFLMTVCVILLSVSGCSLKEIHEQTQFVDNVGFIKGNINVTSNQKGVVIVLRFRDESGIPVRETQLIASENGDFLFSVLPGKHYIAAYIDVNKDSKYQPGEHGNYYGLPSIIDVAPKQTVSLEPITIAGQAPEPAAEIKPIAKVRAVWENIGKVVSMDDPRFTQDNYNMGLWKPFDFLDFAEGGVFFLQEYQRGKVPVLFVHGVMGGPTNFEKMIESLDKQSFQPWVFYYPSGLRLDMISDFLVEAISRLQSKHGFPEFYVIAHSMGGLVTRSFVKKYVQHASGNSERLGLVMTINSPMDGMPSASAGVKHSPIVVPSWRDVEPESSFLCDIHTWNWPQDIPYHLVISYTTGESSDGVVPLQSQVPLKVQSESTGMYVFNNDHVGTLSDRDFLALFNRILADRLGE
ncbi:MAG: alpha/beta hydrolase [Deltaproteobacteria bacterium]|nr:alpha/beta hydrolase [Deltaproteobacteria bacterium]MBW1718334.1 alpha/beta hydrolase [Deltaproteobacteria bacterium]MBW1932565.1 alpha/beta hydrolase [Deltaproteobacteria bacterium]MBW1937501.1 alpha/beta hydrolase [Deltaproteobacteria bacterium]MBW1964825.1 alpha/beta hydrolase [Deltaproteobacteria bacterium]